MKSILEDSMKVFLFFLCSLSAFFCDSKPIGIASSDIWTIEAPKDQVGISGVHNDLVLHSDGTAHVAFYEEKEGSLYFYSGKDERLTKLLEEPESSQNQGMWPSLFLHDDATPLITFFNPSSLLSLDFQSIFKNSSDPSSPGVLQKLKSSNTLMLYNGKSKTVSQIDSFGGMYNDLLVLDSTTALVGYCSFLSSSCPRIEDIFSGKCGDLQASLRELLASSCSAAISRINLETGEKIGETTFLSTDQEGEAGFSFKLARIPGSDDLIAAFTDATNFALYIARSSDRGVTWGSPERILAAEHDRIEYSIDLQVYPDKDMKYHVAIVFADAPQGDVFYAVSDDRGVTWRSTELFSSFLASSQGIPYFSLAHTDSGDPLLAYYARSTRSLGYFDRRQDIDCARQLIDGTGSGLYGADSTERPSVGRYVSMAYSPSKNISIIAYHDFANGTLKIAKGPSPACPKSA